MVLDFLDFLVVARFSSRYLYWRAGGGHVLCTRCMLEGLAVAMFSYVLFWRWPCSHYFSANGGRAHDTQTTPRKRREGDAGREPNKTKKKTRGQTKFLGLVVARFSYRYLYWRAGGGHILCTRCMLEGLAVAMFLYVLFWRWPCSHFFSANGGRAHDTQTTPKKREGEPNKTTR